jgi:hypothetical protein
MRHVLFDQGVVVGEIVLGEEVQDQCRSSVLRDRALGDVPWLLSKALTSFPGNDVVKVPISATGKVLGGESFDFDIDGLDQFDLFGVCHEDPSEWVKTVASEGASSPSCRGG